MADRPTRDFGTRKPVAIQPAQPVKRGQVALLLMGTLAVGGGAYALMPGESCEPGKPGLAAPSGQQSGADCRPRGSSGGGRIGSRSGFFSGDSSSSRSPAGSSSSSDSSSSHVTRGGFGGFAHAFGSHFSGRG